MRVLRGGVGEEEGAELGGEGRYFAHLHQQLHLPRPLQYTMPFMIHRLRSIQNEKRTSIIELILEILWTSGASRQNIIIG